MTRKEKLAQEYIELKKQFDGEDFKEGLTQHQIWYLTKEFKACELEFKIEAVRRQLAAKAEREAKEAWFETPEGKAWKESNEKAQKENWDAQVVLRRAAHEYTRIMVRSILGDEFDVTRFGSGSFEVGLVKEYLENGTPVAHFGHEFTVGFENDWLTEDFRWEMNYGCMGSFKLGKDENRTKFLVGLATFASSPIVSGCFKEKMKEFANEYDKLRKEGYRLEEEAKNLKIAV